MWMVPSGRFPSNLSFRPCSNILLVNNLLWKPRSDLLWLFYLHSILEVSFQYLGGKYREVWVPMI